MVIFNSYFHSCLMLLPGSLPVAKAALMEKRLKLAVL